MMGTYRRRSRRQWVDGEEAEQGTNAGSLVDSDLVRGAETAARATRMSLIEAIGRRAVSVFLDRDDYEKVERMLIETLGNLMMECLPAFAHGQGGQIAFATRLGDDGTVINPVQHSVKINGQARNILREGYLFAYFSDERVVVSVEPVPVVDGLRLRISVRSNNSSAEFWQRWQDFARKHNYLLGHAFFADGQIIERERTYTWDDILLPEQTKRMVRTHVEGFLRHRLRLKDLGVKTRRGLILSGSPGTGKTLLGKVLADTLDVSFMWVSPRHVKNAGSFEAILSVARFVSPTVIFLEDLDLFAGDRDKTDGWIGLGELMNQLDGAVDNEDIVTIATTNRLDVIEKALRNRPGRFDRIIEMNEMDEFCRRRMLQRRLARATIAGHDMDYLVSETNEYTGAQLEELADTLHILAMERYNSRPVFHTDRTAGDDQAGDSASGSLSIGRSLIEAALEEVGVERKPRIGFNVA